MNKKLKFALCNPELVLAGCFLVATTSMVVINVICRYVLRIGISWSEEFSTTCFVWTVYLGAASSFRYHKHIGVDLLTKRLPARVRCVVQIFVDIIMLIVNAYLAYLSIVYVSLSYIKKTSILGISSAWCSSCLIVCFCLSTLFGMYDLITDTASFVKTGFIKRLEEEE